MEFNLGAELSVALTENLHGQVEQHLLQHWRVGLLQEDVCFALWHPSFGKRRSTALLYEAILPTSNERRLNGRVTFTTAYFSRVLDLARSKGVGVAALHNHLGPGWQGMSCDDISTERLRAANTLTLTGFPLLGMTLGTDGCWSARFWPRVAPRRYEPRWCSNVRVVGQRLRTTFHSDLRPAPDPRDELIRTVSVWGQKAHDELSRLNVGVVGLGSVGCMVAEGLARMGIERATFIDFDRVKPHNLDRLLGAYPIDARQRRLKVHVVEEAFFKASTASNPSVEACAESVVEEPGFRAALDCDVLFSCVDRPWGRHVMNYLAFAHLIPVIDGGIIVRFRNDRFRGVEWSLRTAAPTRACLQCAGTYDPSDVNLERAGMLEDPSYIQGLDPDHPLRHSENTFMYSMSLAAHELLQFTALTTGLLRRPDFGDQRYHYNLGEMKATQKSCSDACLYPSLTATGETVLSGADMTGDHSAVTSKT